MDIVLYVCVFAHLNRRNGSTDTVITWRRDERERMWRNSKDNDNDENHVDM